MAVPGEQRDVAAALRHACGGCGGSCEGVSVRLLPEEVEPLRERAAKLGISEPIVEGRLERVDGRCVFLDEAARCRLHATFGAASKPLICRQYPFVALRTAPGAAPGKGGVREGIDPGCYQGIDTWRTGPVVTVSERLVTTVQLDPQQERAEAGILGMLEGSPAGDGSGRPGARLGELLAALTNDTPERALNGGFAARWLTLLRRADLGEVLSRPGTAPRLRETLAPALRALPETIPLWRPLPADTEDYALDVIRRVVALRLCAGSLPAVAIVTLLVSGGVLLGGWTVALERSAPEGGASERGASESGASRTGPSQMGPLLAAWTRSIRSPPFWSRILPSPEAARWLALGGGAGPDNSSPGRG